MRESINKEIKKGKEVLFNYVDVFYSLNYADEEGCFHTSREHALNYVYSGEMIVDDGKQKIHIRKGQSVFIRRDHRVTLFKGPADGEEYCGIFMMFTRKFLRSVYQKLEQNKVPTNTPKLSTSIIKLPKNPEIDSLFNSMYPFFDRSVQPREEFMELKMQEGLISLLHINERFSPTLFDFTEPWKIDILEFMNDNYMCEFSMDELANYTGRSLASFKRDFKKVSNLSPQKWLIQKRLEVAYHLIKTTGKKVVDIYSEVGFKNVSHFSTAFKKYYGFSPTNI